MKLTKNQLELLMDLSGQIKEKQNILIGYATPSIPIPMMQTVDFIVWDNPSEEAPQCFHKDDVEVRSLGQTMVRVLPEIPAHDDKVEELFNRIDEDILAGKIWFDPSGEKTVDGVTIHVSKKKFPEALVDVYVTNIVDERFGSVFTYNFISEAAKNDHRFKIAKDIIDELWPQPEKPKLPEVKTQSEDMNNLIRKILKLFGF